MKVKSIHGQQLALGSHLNTPIHRKPSVPQAAGLEGLSVGWRPALRNQAMRRSVESCLLQASNPSSCPLGGICHTCPVQMQAKLTIGQPNDKFEIEADRVADMVMQMAEPPLQQKGLTDGNPIESDAMCDECRRKKPGNGQMALSSNLQTTAPPMIHKVLQQPGRPLDGVTRNFMESRFGQDLGYVRIHTDELAARTAAAVNARAYTVGSHIVAGDNRLSSDAREGRRLLAHELTHVIQQEGALKRDETRQSSASPALRSNPKIQRTTYRCESDSEEEFLQEAVHQAQRDLSTTIRRMESQPLEPVVLDSLWLAFRVRPEDQDFARIVREIRDDLVTTRDGLNDVSVRCDYGDNPRSWCDRGAAAHALPGMGGPIWVCVQRPNGPERHMGDFITEDIRSQSQSIIHEGSHAFLRLTDIAGYFDLTCRETPAYTERELGTDPAMQGGTEGAPPGLRLFTADCYSCFVYYVAYESSTPLAAREPGLAELAGMYRGENLRIGIDYNYPPELMTPDQRVFDGGIVYLSEREGEESFVLDGVPPNSGFTCSWTLSVNGTSHSLATGSPGFSVVIPHNLKEQLANELGQGNRNQASGTVGCTVSLYWGPRPATYSVSIDITLLAGQRSMPGVFEATEEEFLQRRELPGQTQQIPANLEGKLSILRGTGDFLPQAVRTFFEPRIPHDFGQVRIHQGTKAAELAHSLRARAFTVGNDIVFDEAQYAPYTTSGRRLLGHELVHVVQQNTGLASSLQREVSAATPRWLQRLNDRNLIRNVGSTSYQNWIEILQNVLEESQLEQVVDQVCRDPYAQAIVQTQGLRGLIAIYDANGDIEVARQLLQQWVLYSPEMLRDRDISEEGHDEYSGEVARIVDTVGEGTWSGIVAMRRQSPENHEAVVLALLRALQLRLRHGSAEDLTGEPLQSDTSYIASTGCAPTSRLIVHGLRSLGIPARERSVSEFVPYGHRFPWFTSLRRGFAHGDDLYARPIRDPAVLLLDETAIEEHWRSLWEVDQARRRENVRLISAEISQPGTTQQEAERNQILSQLGAQVDRSLEVPSSGGFDSFHVVVRDVLIAAPVQLVLFLANLRGAAWIPTYFNAMQTDLFRLPRMMEQREQFGEHLPENLRQPRLPETRDQAIHEILNAIFRFVVDERARMESNTLTFGGS